MPKELYFDLMDTFLEHQRKSGLDDYFAIKYVNPWEGTVSVSWGHMNSPPLFASRNYPYRFKKIKEKMMKLMTFEEWWRSKEYMRYPLMPEELAEKAWSDARQGMVPEDECIRLPKLEEWKDKSKGIAIMFADYNEEFFHDNDKARWGIQYIPRPIPAWVPRVGDAVFAVGANCAHGPKVAKVLKQNGKWFNVQFTDRDTGEYDIGHLKPFDASKIGKPWSEI